MLLSRKLLQRILGALWLIDGLLQLQPQMFTMNMVNGIMKPMVQGQPAPIEANLQWIVNVTTQHLTAINLLITVIQVLIGLGLLLLSGRWVKGLVIVSIVWAFIVWYGGEGMSMLLTGQSSVLTGAPGAVLLYAILGLAIYPRSSSEDASNRAATDGLLSRTLLRYIFTSFWFFAALLQLQPYWWQPGQISQTLGALVGQGGLDGFIVDPVLQSISDLTASIEIPLNIALIVIFLGLGIALLVVKGKRLRPVLVASIVVSVVIWYIAEAFGMILTGMATDFNSGLLLVVMALACWSTASALSPAHNRFAREVQRKEHSTQTV